MYFDGFYYHDYNVPKDILRLKNELRKVIGNKIELIITQSKGECRPNVTGVLLSVNNETLKLDLGAFRLKEIIGFVPVKNEGDKGRNRKKPLEKELLKMMDKKIQLITAATPPAGRPPNITGKLIDVKDGIVKLRLQSEHEGASEGRVGVYELEDIIGFVPMMGGDSGCSDEKNQIVDPLIVEFKKVLGKRIEVFISGFSSDSPVSVTGTLLEVSEGYIKMRLDNKDENGQSIIVVYQTSNIIGFSQKGTPGGGEDKGKVTLNVTVEWPEGVTPRDVNVTLIREEVPTTVLTVDGVATFISDPTGMVTIKGEEIPGFITPIKEIPLRGRDKLVEETLTYVDADIPVEGVTLNLYKATLIKGETVQLVANIIPPNASVQEVRWESDIESIATVEDGLVTGVSQGTTNITVTTVDGVKTATAQIEVLSIREVLDPDSITALRNELVIFPDTVRVILSNGDEETLPVTWDISSDEDIIITFVVPENPADVYTFEGEVTGTDDETINGNPTLTIEVDKNSVPAVRVEDIILDEELINLYVGGEDTFQLHATVLPENATTKDVIWNSDKENIALVTDGLVKGISPGLAVITAETVDGGHKAFCQVSVSIEPEVELIYATQEVFESPSEVMINVENLVAERVISPTDYFVKVEQSGTNPVLGEGIVTLYPPTETSTGTVEFNLYDEAPFRTTSNYSNEYFVYMSTDPYYPQGDEMTLMTNFKIGTAVPSIPEENIQVYLGIKGVTPPNEELAGIRFILARELDTEPIETTWRDYTDDDTVPLDEVVFNDEVKMEGWTDETGHVIWNEPRETLKLGGYLLLEVTPAGYTDNLNLVNPDSEDGSLLKEVHLTRNAVIVRYITNIYTGS